MKTRLGFVSNSSSSSFCLIVEKEAYKRKLEEVHPYVKAVIEAMAKKEVKFMGHEAVMIGTWSDRGGCDNFEDLEVIYDGEKPKNKWNEEMYPYEAYHEHFSGFEEGTYAGAEVMDC